MKLTQLGYDDWFTQRGADLLPPGHQAARVTAVDRAGYLVRNEAGEVAAEVTGKLRFNSESNQDLPCVGDWVSVQYHNAGDLAIIHGVLPRRTTLRRKHAGKKVDYQMIGANIDVAFIVQSCHYDFNVRRLDRYLVMVTDGGIDPVILLTKTDLVTSDELDEKIEAIRRSGITTEVLTLSNKTGDGLSEFRELLAPARTYSLIGSSGVGKTTLINRLIGQDLFGTKEVSVTGEGTHATVRRQLILLPGGAMLVDTPGMRELGMLAADDGMDESYLDINELAGECRFTDCTHTQEPGCAVLEALEQGGLSRARYENYMKLKKESEHHERSYLERRRRDKAFGRMVKDVMKRKKKK